MSKAERAAKRTTTRLTRTDRIAKRLRNVDAESGFKVKNAEYTVRVYNRVPVEIQGYLMQVGPESVLIRHKRTSASKRMVVSRFATAELIEVFGAIGEISAVTVIRETITSEYTGSIVSDEAGILTIRTQTGETVRIVQANSARVEVSAEDVEGAPAKGKKKKTVKVKEEKVTKKKKRKQKEDDLDDDLDD